MSQPQASTYRGASAGGSMRVGQGAHQLSGELAELREHTKAPKIFLEPSHP